MKITLDLPDDLLQKAQALSQGQTALQNAPDHPSATEILHTLRQERS